MVTERFSKLPPDFPRPWARDLTEEFQHVKTHFGDKATRSLPQFQFKVGGTGSNTNHPEAKIKDGNMVFLKYMAL